MHYKGKYSWLKHLDFILIDLLSLLGAFILAFFMKFDHLILDTRWQSILLTIMLLHLIINLLMNPYSGSLRRSFFETIVRGGQMAIMNLLLASLFMYLMKEGDSYSREVMIETFLFYLIISLVLKYIWRKLLLSGKIKIGQNKPITLVVVGSKDTLERTLTDATAADFQE